MYCNECGAEVPDGSRFCNSCGRPIDQNVSPQDTSTEPLAHAARMAAEAPMAMPAREQDTPSYVIEPEKQTSRTPQVLLALLAIALIAFVLMLSKMGHRQSSGGGVTTQARSIAGVPTPRAENVKLAVGAFTVQPGRYSFSKFTVPQKCNNVSVRGRVTASGGSANEIEVYILSEGEWTNWKNGHQARTMYKSGRVTEETINLRLPSTSERQAATYYIVFNNKFSAHAAKALKADVSLHYDRSL
jgi:hypothetical protein